MHQAIGFRTQARDVWRIGDVTGWEIKKYAISILEKYVVWELSMWCGECRSIRVDTTCEARIFKF